MLPDLTSGGSVDVSFTLNVGGGQLQATATVPAAPINMTQLMPALQVLTTNIVGAVVHQVNAEGYEISCRTGCAACCRQLVSITLVESDALADWIRSLLPEQQAAIHARFSATLHQLAETSLLARLDPDTMPAANTPERQQLFLDYLAHRIDCPFLEDESCSIYPIRPLVCREHLVTSPPEFCLEPAAETHRGIRVPVRISQALATYSQHLTGQKEGWIPLIFLSAWMQQGMSLAAAPKIPRA